MAAPEGITIDSVDVLVMYVMASPGVSGEINPSNNTHEHCMSVLVLPIRSSVLMGGATGKRIC